MNAGDEIIIIVDKDNRETGTAPRRVMREKGLPHRATYILVFNSRGEIFVQKRTAGKDIYPGCFDVAAGGVVLAGESYEESAARELAEELGIRDVPLTRHFDFYHEADNNRVWGRVFSCVYDGILVLQEEEVESGSFLPVERVVAMSATAPFTPDGLHVFTRYLEEDEKRP